MRDSFKISLKPLAAHEGGFSNHPDDPGGATMRGITQRVYDGYNKIHGKPQQSVRYLSENEHDQIYRENYWNQIQADELPLGIDYCVFDGAVNSGPATAVKWLQRALQSEGVYSGPIDGHVGTGVLGALEEVHASEDEIGDRLVDKMCGQRLAFMRTLKNYPSFKNGWETRVREVRRFAKQMNNHQTLTAATVLDAEACGKARDSDTKITETPEGAAATKEITLGGGGLLTWLLSKVDSLSDYVGVLSGMQPATAKILIEGVAIATLTALVAYGAYSIWNVIQRRKRGEGMEAQ